MAVKELYFNDETMQCHAHFFLTVEGQEMREIDVEDFGYIRYGHDAPDYGCSSRSFCGAGRPPQGVLEKYGITRDEFDRIAAWLETEYSFSNCGACG